MSPDNGRRWALAMVIGLLFAHGLSPLLVQPVSAQSNPVEGWAVIMEMLYYPEGWSDIPTGYADSEKWDDTLRALGWPASHINLLRGEITRPGLVNGIEWLVEKSDDNDVVVLFVFSHGNWLRTVIGDGIAVGAAWEEIPTAKRLMVFSACSAGEFIAGIPGAGPEIRVGSVKRNELAWAGIPDENLPVTGEVFNHFFTSAFLNESADANGNGDVSVEEAFLFALPQTQQYILETVFPAFPEYEELCNGSAPEPVMMDMYAGELSLACDEVQTAAVDSRLIGIAISAPIIILAIVVYRYRQSDDKEQSVSH